MSLDRYISKANLNIIRYKKILAKKNLVNNYKKYISSIRYKMIKRVILIKNIKIIIKA